MRILAETWTREKLMTTRDAARLLQISRQGVRKLVLLQQLPYEQTMSGQLLFRYGQVMKAVTERAASRVQRRGALLAAVRVRMLKASADGEASQLALDFGARLKLVGARGKGRKVA